MGKTIQKKKTIYLIFIIIYTIIISISSTIFYHFSQNISPNGWIKLDNNTGTIQATKETIYRNDDNNRLEFNIKKLICPNCFIYNNRLDNPIGVNQWLEDPKSWSTSKDEIQNILKNKINIIQSDYPLEKTAKIGVYLSSITKSLKNKEGLIQYSSHDDLWNKIKEEKAGVECSRLVALYEMFANIAGIPTRKVYVVNNNSEGHVVAESYNIQTQSWYVVDPTYDIYYIQNQDGVALQTEDLLNIFQAYRKLNTILSFTVNKGGETLQINESNFIKLGNQINYFKNNTVLRFDILQPYYLPLQLVE